MAGQAQDTTAKTFGPEGNSHDDGGRSKNVSAYNLRSASTDAGPEHKVCLVQGASRGLGLEFVQQLLARDNHSVVATCRQPDNASELQQLQAQHGSRLQVVQMDITNEQHIEKAAAQVSSINRHLDLLINVSGILHVEGKLSPEKSLAQVSMQQLDLTFKTNAFGPILVAKAFVPLLQKAAQHGGATSEKPAVIASLSARVGSIGDNSSGGWYSYRASKTALNQLNKTMAVELARKKLKIACIVLHPGTCDTDLSKPFQGNVQPGKLFSRSRAVQQLLDIMQRSSLEHSGRFFAWDGQEIPW